MEMETGGGEGLLGQGRGEVSCEKLIGCVREGCQSCCL